MNKDTKHTTLFVKLKYRLIYKLLRLDYMHKYILSFRKFFISVYKAMQYGSISISNVENVVLFSTLSGRT